MSPDDIDVSLYGPCVCVRTRERVNCSSQGDSAGVKRLLARFIPAANSRG